ncbi:RHS repeat-associated core domain-containing protein [Pseudomonas sp. Kh13]|uniref:RHS repeat-associated core domain-containing protein n=1 Tax=Pseudomonas sp. Kh13 TaxID=2093744 RepID=UPI0011840C31|nr:RHS repeat-associated core domain-containing protein [Pseudomonas sp. Kh13]
MGTFFGPRAYTPHGVINVAVAAGLAFCGQYRDPVTGNYPLGNGHRFYSPTLMRFLSPDSLSPFGRGGINVYAYCGGEPVNRHDPTGQVFETAALTLRGLGMASNALTLGYNFLGPSPTDRLGLNAARTSTFGSLLSLGSAAAQFAGVEGAIFGANVGTAISLAATGARAINAAVGPGTSPLRQVSKNFDLLAGGIPAEVAAEIALESVETSPQRGLPVRQSVINRPAPEVNRVSSSEGTPDSWAFQSDTMGVRQRRHSR